jgi:rhodanese-related sulfurtransferase
MKTLDQLVAEAAQEITEIMPWDLAEKIEKAEPMLLLDVREADEFAAMHIANSINVPRGILESACEYGYDETVPALAQAREQQVVVICRSGKRSCLAAATMKQLGYTQTISLKTGLRGWNDFDQPMLDQQDNEVDGDSAEEFLVSKPRPEQIKPTQ